MFHVKQSKPLHQITECPVCESPDFTPYLLTKDFFLSQESFQIVRCDTCGFVFTNPVPFTDQLAGYYDSPDYLSHTASSASFLASVYKIFRSINIKKKYQLVRTYTQQGNMLDIGCGTGELISFFRKKNWTVMGIEPNPSAREFAQQQYGLDVYDESSIESLPDQSFDVVSMWHVLEHVPDLNERMRQVKRMLHQDGQLFIAVPNIESPDARHYKEYWAGLDVPRHLYHFSSDSMKTLLEKHHFQLLRMHPMKMDAYYVSMLSERYRGTHIPYLTPLIQGFRANRLASTDNNYSSMIFVAKLSR